MSELNWPDISANTTTCLRQRHLARARDESGHFEHLVMLYDVCREEKEHDRCLQPYGHFLGRSAEVGSSSQVKSTAANGGP